MTFGREAEQYLCAAVLRSGKAVASEGAVALLSRLLPLLRCAFPRARFLDACPRLDYVISIPKNAVLLRHAEPAMTRARARSARSGRTEHVYGETRYAAGSWKQQRRVVIKAEVVRLAGREPRDNPRFVVTNLGRPPRSLYEKVYCARGDIENRIKELLDGLQIDRTSCCRFAANQLRVLLTAVAYVLNTSTTDFNDDGFEPPTDHGTVVADPAELDLGFFEVASIEILYGRNFNDADRPDTQPVVIISEAMARRFWTDGATVILPWLVVGVASQGYGRSPRRRATWSISRTRSGSRRR